MRSLFFAPANRSDLVQKFPRFSADGYVIDLEDGTPRQEKEVARDALADNVAALRAQGFTGRVFVRVNGPKSPHYLADIMAAAPLDVAGLIVPVAEQAAQLFPAVQALTHCGSAAPKTIIVGIESVWGVINALELVTTSPMIFAVYFGAHDYVSDLRGRMTLEGNEVLYARSRVVLAARAAGILAIDQAVAEVRDDDRFTRDAEAGRNMGYNGKLCLIPRQLEISNRVFHPSPQEIDEARRMVAAFAEAERAGIGTIDFEGRLLDDGPLLKQAYATLAAAEPA